MSNLAAIVANGGYMPADPGAIAALGQATRTRYSNSVVVDHPALRPLTDIFALPPWVPFANVFSIGDVAHRHRRGRRDRGGDARGIATSASTGDRRSGLTDRRVACVGALAH